MTPSLEEIKDSIFCILFVSKKSPEELEAKYKETEETLEELKIKKGDEWKIRNGRYIFQEDRTFIPRYKLSAKVIYVREPKIPLELKSYTSNKKAKLKEGISPYNFIYDLAKEIRSFYVPQIEVEKTEDSITQREKLGIGSRAKNVRRTVAKAFRQIGFNEREEKKKLIKKIYKILKEKTESLDSERMAFFYIACILIASEIEEGTVNQVAIRLQARYRGLLGL